MIGTTLGHYQIESLLGTGGMGTVYLATDTKLHRKVALKVLPKELALDRDRRERFEREARAAAALNHPHIVTIHSVEESGGVLFLTLELIDGPTLAEIIPPDGLPLDRVLTLGIQIADAVGAAHQRGITHRDLKPANIMVTRDGRVKVLDFGLAKLKEDARVAAEAAMPTAALTGEGKIVGTVAYMSPEQAEGREVDQRSDVFSLGVLLYEMATGVRPFQGDTQMSILSSIIKDTPKPLSDVKVGVPRELAKIVHHCLAKDAEDRYQTAKDLRNDLRTLKNELTSGEIVPITTGSGTGMAAATATRGSWQRLALLGGVALALTVAAAVLIPWLRRETTPASTAPSRPFDSINLTRLTTSGTSGLAAISADGKYVVHVSAQTGQQNLWLRQVATTSNVQIVAPDNMRFDGVTFSPDSNHIYYVVYPRGASIAKLFQVPVLGGGARLILEDIDTAPSFSPDGKQFAFLRGVSIEGAAQLMIANADGSGARILASRKLAPSFTLDAVAWSPDGQSIAVTGFDNSHLRGQVVIVDVKTGAETVLATPNWRTVTALAWLPGGDSLAVNAQESASESSSQIFVVSYPSGAARRITNDLSSYAGLGVSADGHSLVCSRGDRLATIWTMPLGDPSKAVAIASGAGSDDGIRGLVWTPDGRLVYASEASGNPDIWIMNADGSNRVQLTSEPGQDLSPRVTPDGKYIVFVSDRDGGLRAWRMALDGGGATRLSEEQVARSRAYVSGDSKWVYFTDYDSESRRVSIDGGKSVSVFAPEVMHALSGPRPPGFHEPQMSPDGSTLMGHYTDANAGGERVVLIPVNGGPIKYLPTVPPFTLWMPDSRTLLYADLSKPGVTTIVKFPLGGGAASVVGSVPETSFGGAVSSDGKRLAIVRGRQTSDVVLI